MFKMVLLRNPTYFNLTFTFLDAPNVELVLGKSISAESIYEGGDVYFDCKVNSSPSPDRVYWYHNVSISTITDTKVTFSKYLKVLPSP